MDKKHYEGLMGFKSLADQQPTHQRIALYRWLANVAGDTQIAKEFNSIAIDMESTEQRSMNLQCCLQFPNLGVAKK